MHWWQCQAEGCNVMWLAQPRKRCWACRSRKAALRDRGPLFTSSFTLMASPSWGATFERGDPPPGLALSYN